MDKATGKDSTKDSNFLSPAKYSKQPVGLYSRVQQMRADNSSLLSRKIDSESNRFSNSNSKTIIQPKLDIPLVERAPKNAVSIRKFIQLVQKEEERYSVKEQHNTKLMITRLRKIFYGKDGWDKYLIAGAKDVARPYETAESEKPRYELELDWAPDPTVIDKEYTVTDPKTGKTPEIAKNQEIRLADGSFLDIGHVFAGLDALNYPQAADGPFTVNIDSNVDAVTWVGDLGSVLAETQFKALHEKKPILSDAEKQEVIDEYAPARDMLGNIDAYVIGSTYKIGQESRGQKVSEILQDFYLGNSETAGHQSFSQRYSIFARQVGLKDWDGSKFGNEDSWCDNYSDQVNDAAALYAGTHLKGLSKYGAAIGMSMNEGSKKVVRLFLKMLKQRIAAEPR